MDPPNYNYSEQLPAVSHVKQNNNKFRVTVQSFRQHNQQNHRQNITLNQNQIQQQKQQQHSNQNHQNQASTISFNSPHSPQSSLSAHLNLSSSSSSTLSTGSQSSPNSTNSDHSNHGIYKAKEIYITAASASKHNSVVYETLSAASRESSGHYSFPHYSITNLAANLAVNNNTNTNNSKISKSVNYNSTTNENENSSFTSVARAIMSQQQQQQQNGNNNHHSSTANTNPANPASASDSSLSSANYSLVDPNKIHLFVKAGQDGRSQGACPFCQDVFIQLLIKAQTNKFNFDVITINLDNPPREFKELSIKPPVLIHGSSSSFGQNTNESSNSFSNGSSPESSHNTSSCSETSSSSLSSSSESSENNKSTSVNAIILSDVDEIAEYLDKLYPNSPLCVANCDAKRVSLNVFSKFSFFVRDVSSTSKSPSKHLESELEKIDHYLGQVFSQNTNNKSKQQQTLFLNGGSTMSLLDCSLLPKLQHIRVAGESIKKFKIPARFVNLWKYMQNAYHSDAFQKSCPPDREIIWNWSKSFLTRKDLLTIMHEAPHKTLTVPLEQKATTTTK